MPNYPKKETQSQKLYRISNEARDARLKYQSGEITEQQYSEKIHELRQPETIWAKLSSLFGL